MALLSNQDRAFFAENGYLLIPGFYDLDGDIHPILRDIHTIIGLTAERHGVTLERVPYSPETFDSGYEQLIAHDRAIGGEIYDLVKQIPAFLRLISHPRADALFRDIRSTEISGIGAASYGIRIDLSLIHI